MGGFAKWRLLFHKHPTAQPWLSVRYRTLTPRSNAYSGLETKWFKPKPVSKAIETAFKNAVRSFSFWVRAPPTWVEAVGNTGYTEKLDVSEAAR